MSIRIVATCLLILATDLFAAGQHGSVGRAFFGMKDSRGHNYPIFIDPPYPYQGDTWTGTISSFDPDKGTITLTYEHKGKVESFTGVFKQVVQVVDQTVLDDAPQHSYQWPDNCRTILRTNTPPYCPVQMPVQVGSQLTAYYTPKGQKYDETVMMPAQGEHQHHTEVARDNLIFEIWLPRQAKR